MPAPPRPVRDMPRAVAASVDWLFTDIDDTLTADGLLQAESFAALWQLHRTGVHVVPVTGRPAGWCDHIARMWPVAGVVGENGAFTFVYDRAARRMERTWLMNERERVEGMRRLESVRHRVLAEVPGSAVAADQAYRSTDLAIDFCEDVPPLGRESIQRICEIAHEEGATCKVSSIHVNCWYGSHDKVTGVERFLRTRGLDLDDLGQRAAFCGDSPNDEPLFARVPTSVGVANIAGWLEDLRHPPCYITHRPGGLGFAELAQVITAAR